MLKGASIPGFARDSPPYVRAREPMPAGANPDRRGRDDRRSFTPWIISLGAGAVILAWTLVLLTVKEAHFGIVASRTQVGVEAVGGLADLFGALVLFLFPPARARRRLHWLGAGLVVLGIAGLLFGYLEPLMDVTPNLNRALYTSLLARMLAAALFALALLPRQQPPRLTWSAMAGILSIFGLLNLCIAGAGPFLPLLDNRSTYPAAVAQSHPVLVGLTGWHWLLSSLALALVLVATVGAGRYTRDGTLGGWLVVAMVMLAFSQLHNMLWPSAYSSVLTTGDLLALGFGMVVAVGAVLDLRVITERRTTKLAIEEEQSKRLVELGVLKANFTAMVAHELGSPLAAIRMFTDMLAADDLDAVERAQAIEGIQTEIDTLNTLVNDVQTAARVERDDFEVHPRPASLGSLLAETAVFAKSIPGDHPFKGPIAVNEMVYADPDRIRQVMRNLVSNAAKYSPPATPIELRTRRIGHRVRIEVIDHGPGIHPEDVARIFEKFGRGRNQSGQKVAGVGLGLYLSRRIVQAHGSDLTVASRVGGGAVFGFELEVIL